MAALSLSPRHERILDHGVTGGADNDSDPGAAGGEPGGGGEATPPAGGAPAAPAGGDAGAPAPSPAGGQPQIGDTRPAPDPLEGAPPGGKRTPSEYEVRLRTEVANYRKQAEPYLKAFEGLEPEVAEGVLELAQMMGEDPAAARVYLAQMIGAELPDEEQPDPRYMTVEQFQAMQAEARAEQEAAAERDGLVSSMREGAKRYEIEPGTPGYHTLLAYFDHGSQVAAKQAAEQGFDPQAALEEYTIDDAAKAMFADLEQYGQARVDGYVQGKTGGPSPVTTGGTPSGAKPPDEWGWKDSNAGARAYLEGRAGQ